MFSLHRVDYYYFEHVEFFINFNNVFPNFLNFFYFTFLFITLIFSKTESTKFNIFFKNIFILICWLLLIFTWLVFLFKLYSNFTFWEQEISRKSFELMENNIIFEFSIFGDTLVLLCITTLIVSWVFLSELYLFFSSYNTIYFFIFIIFTLNMVYADNLLVMFLFFELIFLPSLFFVYMLGYSKKVEKTIKYLLIWTLSGSFIVLCSLSYIYTTFLCLDIKYINIVKFSTLESTILFFCFFIGFGIKIPLWPFHYWLTKVHVEAPTGFSIFLSGYLVKTALFCLIYFILLFKNNFLGYIALSWVFWGTVDSSIRMWSATDIKRLIAFATIQEMNLLLVFSLLSNNSFFKILNSFIVVHGLLSALLFFLIDQVQKRYYSRNLVSLSGLAYKLSILPIFIWFSILIFRGFPVFSKFLIEWEILTLMYSNYSYFGFFIFFFINIFGVVGFCRIWFIILYGQPSKELNNSVDMLKLDKVIALFLVTSLTLIAFLICLF